jgi:hypothetical protein
MNTPLTLRIPICRRLFLAVTSLSIVVIVVFTIVTLWAFLQLGKKAIESKQTVGRNLSYHEA